MASTDTGHRAPGGRSHAPPHVDRFGHVGFEQQARSQPWPLVRQPNRVDHVGNSSRVQAVAITSRLARNIKICRSNHGWRPGWAHRRQRSHSGHPVESNRWSMALRLPATACVDSCVGCRPTITQVWEGVAVKRMPSPQSRPSHSAQKRERGLGTRGRCQEKRPPLTPEGIDGGR